ncbi:MAG: SAM-dependent methyltransferase (EC [uncultured Thiotrichaceae bacterium]|uniref:Ribosomal RNA small subunit methyltransferase J n=1 Tax=uncultured Thiotrichaceae bacterium TaxID=298394 RepID=A0A6S6TI66_9GAMM|nr:MAG: SAM-dependent methyltransferase (EC [uncultured Thiotrichaceae bacterium]
MMSHHHTTNIAVSGDDVTDEQQQLLCQKFSLKHASDIGNRIDYLLYLKPTHLELQLPQQAAFTPLFFDFVSGKNNHRRLYGGGKNQDFAKAIGIKKFPDLSVIDATTGAGKDSFVMATLGCTVTSLERNLPLYLLLEDALNRCSLCNDNALRAISERITLKHIDSHDYLKMNTKELADIIYLDPMFPAREKSAKVKKEMQIFHELVGKDTDAAIMLNQARERANKRVVVKRPIKSPYLDEKTPPSFQIKGKTTRYDVYLPL